MIHMTLDCVRHTVYRHTDHSPPYWSEVFLKKFLRATAATAVACLSHCSFVCPSVCLSHGWISQKRCKLGSANLHHRLPGRL